MYLQGVGGIQGVRICDYSLLLRGIIQFIPYFVAMRNHFPSKAQFALVSSMPTVIFWLVLIFFVGSLAIIWWTLFVDHDLQEEPEDDKRDDPYAGDGVSLNVERRPQGAGQLTA